MTILSELYTDFFRIDLDAPGGYARVADVVARQEDGTTSHRAFKLMRHELDGKQIGLQRFENELKILVGITKDKNAPSAITRIYDSGFVEAELSKDLRKLRHKNEKLDLPSNLEIVPTGLDIQKFLDAKSALMEEEPNRWLPYLVVDLAPYDDSLSRQIKAHPEYNVNLYDLPVHTVVDMALQLLDVMDYMHKKLRYAYIDWKPEHIYWNEASRQLKLIDWNVTIRLNGGSEEKQTIREDLRMFCGAALYCSIALSDPESSDKPIGPEPKVPPNLVRLIHPRYWTDRPNFYQRESMLDEKIKLLVQKGLDPNQGFNFPEEARNVLMQYIEQSNKPTENDQVAKLPFDAIQHYRRARSYIAAKDYEYANYWLELAVEISRKAGVHYSDAEQLLNSVRDILELDEVRKKVTPLLEKGQWKEVLDLYAKAVEVYPSNELLKKEYDGLQGLVRAESELHNKGALRLFTNPFRLKTILDSTKDIINPNNPLYSFVKQQYNQIRFLQLSGMFILLAFVLITSISIGKYSYFQLLPAATISASTPTLAPSTTPTLIDTLEPTATLTITVTASPTNTLTPTATAFTVVGYGMLDSSYFFPVVEPNGERLGSALARKQLVTIIEKKEDHGSLWYKCIWEVDGVSGTGWILADKIKIVPVPTATATP